MRDMLATKMAELKFEAPLARFEESDDWTTGTVTASAQDDNSCFLQQQVNNNNTAAAVASLLAAASVGNAGDADKSGDSALSAAVAAATAAAAASGGGGAASSGPGSLAGEEPASFGDAFSGSLEDLVHTFDDKITRCFCDYQQSVETLAPVQVRSQEEIMSECQMWWTITGNFGNILPIDWSKSCTRKLHVSGLNLNEPKDVLSPDDELPELSSEDEAVASDLDMHSLILSGLNTEPAEPLKTADEVIREIDDLLQESPPVESPSSPSRPAPALASPLYEDKLRHLSAARLNDLYLELELLIRDFSETLIAELALRDELEYEKELKNTFISLLLAVQNRRRQHYIERKRAGRSATRSQNGLEPKYLTTVIPYHLGSGPPDNQALQVLIKILKAINEDSPTVPTLLTDYILKVLCPT